MSPEHASNQVRTVLPRELQDECKEQVVNDLADCCVLMSKPVLLLCRFQFKRVEASGAGTEDLQHVWSTSGIPPENFDGEESNFVRWEMGINAASEAENLSYFQEIYLSEQTPRKGEVLKRRSTDHKQKLLSREQNVGGQRYLPMLTNSN